MSEKPTNPPKMAYVLLCNNDPCFSADTFERVNERCATLMKRDADPSFGALYHYRIVRVEAE